MPHAGFASTRRRRLALLAAAGGVALLGLAARRGISSRNAARRRQEKADEDRHIGFRWLAWEARLPHERDAEAVFRAVAAELGVRLGRGEAEHLAAHLPLGLRAVWDEETHRAGRPAALDLDEFVARVQSRLGLERYEHAEVLISIVFGWLKHLAPEERADAAAPLPEGLRRLWEKAQLPAVPPWRRLEIGAQPVPRPAQHVRLLVWEPGLPSPQELDGELLELPRAGARFWWGSSAFRVQQVEPTAVPRIHLSPDPEREARLREGLPAACVLSLEQRAGEAGRWCAEVIGPDGRVLGVGHDDDCDVAGEAARAQALHAVAVEGGYHPEREFE